ncbi:hypothetical protein RNF85_000394 [Salmonella enterica]|nr:hypothetical protein [Salmonella enterica]
MTYELEFNDAILRSKKFELEIPEISFQQAPLLSGERGEVALKVIQKKALGFTAQKISQQCFGYMYFMKGFLEEALQSPLYYTLGYIDYNHSPVFYTDEDGLKALLHEPITSLTSINLHAWLTTPNFEIIDLTFGTTYGVIKNIPEVIGCCAFQHYSQFDDRMIYHPQLIGDDYLKKIGVLVEFDFFYNMTLKN